MVFYTQPYFDNFHSFFFPNVPRFPSFFISFLFREFPFSHYFSIDLLVTDSLIFPSFENVFLFPPLFLKFPFTGCRILGWKFFFFSLALEKSYAASFWPPQFLMRNLSFKLSSPLQVTCHFSLTAFKNFPLSFIFGSLVMMYICVKCLRFIPFGIYLAI